MGKGLIEKFTAFSRSVRTRETYTYDLTQWEGYLRSRRKTLLSAREADAIAWKAHLEERGLAPVTIARMLTVAKSFYQFLKGRTGSFLTRDSRNPFEEVKAPRFDTTVGKTPCPTQEEVRKLFETIPKATRWGVRDQAILMLLFKQGLRVLEVASLKKEHLRKVGDLLAISLPGKRGSLVQTVLPATSAKVLEEHLRMNPPKNEFVFQSLSNHASPHLTRRAIRMMVRKYVERAELEVKNIRCHSGRVYFITQAYLKTRDLERVARAVGHRNIATTRKYLRFQDVLTDHPALLMESEDSDTETARRPHAA